jgi:hypothetical protein
MKLETLAAFGGLTLGLINLGILIYKDFLVKGKLELLDDEFQLRLENKYPEFYDIQIDLRLHAKKDNIQIKKVILLNQKEFTNERHNNIKEIELFRAIPYKKLNLSDFSIENYPNEVDKVYDSQSFSLIDLKIEKKTMKSITYNTRLSGVRESDGWELIPKNDWKLKILYDKTELIKTLTPKIIS